jgi:hypothetical protein
MRINLRALYRKFGSTSNLFRRLVEQGKKRPQLGRIECRTYDLALTLVRFACIFFMLLMS